VILFGVLREHCLGCDHETDQLPLCDDCLTRFATSGDPDQPQQEAA
jgi:hypothetical protein